MNYKVIGLRLSPEQKIIAHGLDIVLTALRKRPISPQSGLLGYGIMPREELIMSGWLARSPTERTYLAKYHDIFTLSDGTSVAGGYYEITSCIHDSTHVLFCAPTKHDPAENEVKAHIRSLLLQ